MTLWGGGGRTVKISYLLSQQVTYFLSFSPSVSLCIASAPPILLVTHLSMQTAETKPNLVNLYQRSQHDWFLEETQPHQDHIITHVCSLSPLQSINQATSGIVLSALCPLSWMERLIIWVWRMGTSLSSQGISQKGTNSRGMWHEKRRKRTLGNTVAQAALQSTQPLIWSKWHTGECARHASWGKLGKYQTLSLDEQIFGFPYLLVTGSLIWQRRLEAWTEFGNGPAAASRMKELKGYFQSSECCLIFFPFEVQG